MANKPDHNRHNQRQCPLCLTMGSMSASHRRNSHETFLSVVAPFVRPYRCSACNWRGMVGRFHIARHNITNTWINAIVYYGLLALIVYGLVELRAQMHPQ